MDQKQSTLNELQGSETTNKPVWAAPRIQVLTAEQAEFGDTDSEHVGSGS